MHGNDVLVFLLSVAALLGVARLLGELARVLGLPMVVGELLAGVLLGRTGLGRLAPEAYAFLLPEHGLSSAMLAGTTTLGVVLLLTVAGLEVDIAVVQRRGRSALAVSVLGVLVPLAGGVALGYLLPSDALAEPGRRHLFAAFMGVALSISALPVIARTLLDLGLLRADIGLLVMTAAMISDLLGWVAFSVLLGPLQGTGVHFAEVATPLALTLGLSVLCVVFGRRLVDAALERIERRPDLAPGRVLSLMAVLSLLIASATQAIGVHAVLGGFLAGVTIGESPRLRERTRQTVQQFVANVFAPIFFAGVALRVDMVASFSWTICAAVLVVATVAKVAGAAAGARLSKIPWRESLAIGFGLNARGAMEIILALVAREAGLIDDRIFVALVVMAVGTSVVAGPAMTRLLGLSTRARRAAEDDAATLVRHGAFVGNLAAATPARAIEELGVALRPVLGDLVEPALIAVLEREMLAPTGLGDGVAMPHAGVEGLTHPVVALGLAEEGVDFDAPDGTPARIVFLVLMPPRAYEREVHVLAALARSVFDDAARASLHHAKNAEEAVRCLGEHAARAVKA